jgi:hypothetical protein
MFLVTLHPWIDEWVAFASEWERLQWDVRMATV